jgi:hypothetical protein
MNKDQKLLEEAYKKICESTKDDTLLASEENLINLIADLLVESIEREEPRLSRSNGIVPLDKLLSSFDFYKEHLVEKFLKAIDCPSGLQTACAVIYLDYGCRSFSDNSHFHFFGVNKRFTDKSFLELTLLDGSKVKADYKDKQAIQKVLRDYIIRATDERLNNSARVNPSHKRFFEWRKKKIQELQIDKQLSKDFSEEDLKALEDF